MVQKKFLNDEKKDSITRKSTRAQTPGRVIIMCVPGMARS